MSRLPIYVLADDLTGAAEIAAIAHQAGQRAVVYTTIPTGRVDADVVVVNTETRLMSPARAAKRVAQFATKLRSRPHAAFFKKTDSVLRGAVRSELDACVAALGYERSLLVPCNPSLGRVIRDGRYYLGGQLLHKTAFARDPHHPRTTADVVKLLEKGSRAEENAFPELGGGRQARAGRGSPETARAFERGLSRIHICMPTTRLPAVGLIVGEADTPADVSFWAGQIQPRTLPAGGADFFRAWLRATADSRPDRKPGIFTAGDTLLLSGTATPPNPVTPLPGVVHLVKPNAIPSAAALAARVRESLARDHCATVAIGGSLARDARVPIALSRVLIQVGVKLHRARACRHLLIAGGATASGVLGKLGWTRLEVLRVWGPGTVTLRPVADPKFTVTLKPGSYRWPTGLSQHFDVATPLVETAAR